MTLVSTRAAEHRTARIARQDQLAAELARDQHGQILYAFTELRHRFRALSLTVVTLSGLGIAGTVAGTGCGQKTLRIASYVFLAICVLGMALMNKVMNVAAEHTAVLRKVSRLTS